MKREKVDGIPTIAMPRVERALLVRGAAGCGKTHALVEKARSLLAQGEPASELLVLCATPDAAREFRGRLGEPDVRVACASELACELLALPAAREMFGFGSRVLLPYEEDILFEDVKVSGLEVERLRGMLAFFKRSMTEISDDHPDFLMDDDELAVMGALRRGLELRHARLDVQVSADAARFLTASAAAARRDHVLVDDFQLLCRASQVMAGLLARKSLCVAADPAALDRAFEPYPYVAGIDEFLTANPHAEVVELAAFHGSAAVRSAVNAMRAEAGLAPCDAPDGDVASGNVAIEVLRNPKDEIARAADLIAGAIADGMAPGDVYAVSPVDDWADRLAEALGTLGIRSARARDWSGLLQSGADDTTDGRYLRTLTALLLAGDPTDDCAWRDWCAFDDPLAASGAVDAIATFASPRGMGMREALAWLTGDGRDDVDALRQHDVQHVLDAYREGVGLIERVEGLMGDELLRTLANEVCGQDGPVPTQLAQLCAGAPLTADARSLREHVLRKADNPGWEPMAGDGTENLGAVRIGPMDRLCGLSPRLLVFVGFVNGFFPGHGFFDETVTPPGKVAAAHAADARRLCVAAGKARETLAFTAFTTMPCADAERLHAKIDRIALERRVRIARVSPSIFCEVVGSESRG